MKDHFQILKAWAANGTIMGVVTVSSAEAWLKIVLLVLTIIYTAKNIWWPSKKEK